MMKNHTLSATKNTATFGSPRRVISTHARLTGQTPEIDEFNSIKLEKLTSLIASVDEFNSIKAQKLTSLIVSEPKIDEFNSIPKSIFKRLLKSLLKGISPPFLRGLIPALPRLCKEGFLSLQSVQSSSITKKCTKIDFSELPCTLCCLARNWVSSCSF